MVAEHYYSKEQKSQLRISKIKARLLGIEFEFYTSGGVFSPKKIDKGTKVLIENCLLEDGWNVLDLGCGYGAVGISIAIKYPLVNVVMSDVNKRALMLARKNIENYKIKNISVVDSDCFEKLKTKHKFDTLLLNPPQSAGKKLCFRMIEESKKYLTSHGLLQIVARHNKGGSELEKKMKAVFGNVKTVAKKGGYRVYVGERK